MTARHDPAAAPFYARTLPVWGGITIAIAVILVAWSRGALGWIYAASVAPISAIGLLMVFGGVRAFLENHVPEESSPRYGKRPMAFFSPRFVAASFIVGGAALFVLPILSITAFLSE